MSNIFSNKVAGKHKGGRDIYDRQWNCILISLHKNGAIITDTFHTV